MARLLFSVLATVIGAGKTDDGHGGWSYDPASVANEWPGDCRTGAEQSPVHMVTPWANMMTAQQAPPYEPRVPAGATAIVESRRPELVLRVHTDGAAAASKNPGVHWSTDYDLTRVRFRWPAEHQLDDELADLELQFVFQRTDFSRRQYDDPKTDVGGIVAIASLYLADGDADNPFLAPIVEAVAAGGNDMSAVISTDFGALIAPANRTTRTSPVQLFRYRGSETSPGCREIVDWRVYRDYGQVSASQVRRLAAATGVPEARRPHVRNSDNQREYALYDINPRSKQRSSVLSDA